ncbi:hypothetical protein BKP64_06370 [Marinobacter salinus]|uniref:Antitoxin SocA-like Panacea domain-containing protein n=1 Tax=Marinobacter salinus TaxID=1874317 RepID=A0A1D9GJL9_9GAMM|nr:hypothetical protein [Marinobacter salinus]AOY87827.1 hypothetical protein BKP64_06370 [Marinobacter salinus]
MNATRIEQYIKAILAAAEGQGSNGLSTTALTKYLYLLDYYSSLRDSDYVQSTSDWIFHHFGPYSRKIDQTIRQMADTGSLTMEGVETEAGDGAVARIYRLPSNTSRASLRDLDLPRGVPLRLETDLGRFRYDLRSLLNHVYFETEPMQSAKPGKLLSFPGPDSEAKPEDVRSFRMQISKAKAERIQALMAKRAAAFLKSRELEEKPTRGIYDEHYMAFESELSEVANEVDGDKGQHLKASANLSRLYE